MKIKGLLTILIVLAFGVGILDFSVRTAGAKTVIKFIGGETYTDGSLLRASNGEILVFQDGALHKIPDPTTFNARSYDWNKVEDADEALLAEFSTGFEFLPEGATIRAYNTLDVYIIKYVGIKQFKRLILNPSVFESYGHLRWEDILDVEQSVVDSFPSARIVVVAGTNQVYRLTADGDTGIKQTITSDKIIALGYDPGSVYEINAIDFDSYSNGSALGGESGDPTVCSSLDCFVSLAATCQLGELDNIDYSVPSLFGSGLEFRDAVFLKIVGTNETGACVFIQEPRIGTLVISDAARQTRLNAGQTDAEINADIQGTEDLFNSASENYSIQTTCSGTGSNIATYITNFVAGSGSVSCAAEIGSEESVCTFEPGISCVMQTTPKVTS